MPDEGALGAATTWSEPAREVAPARERALALLDAGETPHCVWSGRGLEAATPDIDHYPRWSAWPCGEGVPPGEHEVAITVATAPKRRRSARDMPVHPEPWDDSISPRREDMYGDDGG